MPVEGTALPLWGLEIDPDRARDDFRAFNARDDGKVRITRTAVWACHPHDSFDIFRSVSCIVKPCPALEAFAYFYLYAGVFQAGTWLCEL